MQKGKDSLIMPGSQGPQGFCFSCRLPGLFLQMPSIQDSLSVAQTGQWASPPWRVTVKCYSPAQTSKVSLWLPPSFHSINSSAGTPGNTNFPQCVSKLNSIYSGQLQVWDLQILPQCAPSLSFLQQPQTALGHRGLLQQVLLQMYMETS